MDDCSCSAKRPFGVATTIGAIGHKATFNTVGANHFVVSIVAQFGGCRVGLALTGKRRLITAHANNGRLVTAIIQQS